MPPKRMTANPVRPSRHRAGKQTGADSSSDSDSDAEEATTTAPATALPPPPKAASAGKIISNLSNVDLNARRQEAQAAEARRVAAAKAEQQAAEEDFVTEEESGAEGGNAKDDDDESEEEESSEEESSSEDEAPRRMMMRPKFIPKSQRGGGASGKTAAEEEEEARLASEAAKKKAADALVEEQIKKDLAARAAGKKHWDDDEDAASDVDTTDGLDPAAEEAAWRVRELKRLKRARAAIEEREAELAEVERRRNLTAEERAAEDEAFLAKQQEEKDGKGKMGFMQKYFHKGAFFRDEAEAAGLLQRDLMGARIADDVRNREALPEYLQRRDMTKLGRKGATKYRDMRSEDTGSWGAAQQERRGGGRFEDDRFKPDDERFRPDERAGKGANAMPLGERRREDRRRRSRSRSRSPRRERDNDYRGSRKRSTSREGGDDKRRRVEADR